MENTFLQSLSFNQWVELFIAAMTVLVVCAFVIMISLFVVSDKLSVIMELLVKNSPKDDDLPHAANVSSPVVEPKKKIILLKKPRMPFVWLLLFALLLTVLTIIFFK